MRQTFGERLADDPEILGRENSISLYEDTDDFLDVFWDNIDQAKHLICLTTYEIDNKLVSSVTVNKLCNACERGVKVYMVLEDLN